MTRLDCLCCQTLLDEPGETPAIGDVPKSPPPAASQIKTETMSPIPI